MLRWLKGRLSQQDAGVRVPESATRTPPEPPDGEPLVRDVPTLLQPIDLDWEPEPDRRADRNTWQTWFRERERRFSLIVDRNLLGRELEKTNDISTVVALYEANIRDACEGNFPYDRLAIIYRREDRLDDEIRVLKRGIEVFSAYRGPRTDVQPKLRAFQARLRKAQSLREKRSVGST